MRGRGVQEWIKERSDVAGEDDSCVKRKAPFKRMAAAKNNSRSATTAALLIAFIH